MKSPYSSSANKDVLVAILQINNYFMCFYWLIFCFFYSLLLAPVLKIRSQYQPVLHSSSKPLGHELQKRWGPRKSKSDCLWLDGYGLDLKWTILQIVGPSLRWQFLVKIPCFRGENARVRFPWFCFMITANIKGGTCLIYRLKSQTVSSK